MQSLTREKVEELIVYACRWQTTYLDVNGTNGSAFLDRIRPVCMLVLIKAREALQREAGPDAMMQENAKLREQLAEAHDLLEQTQDMDAKKFFSDMAEYTKKWGWR